MKFHFSEPEDDDTSPWLISDDAANDVAEVFSNENSTVSISRADSIVTARMFAAAPELLAALHLTKGNIDRLVEVWGSEGVTRRVIDAINAAIAKAEGSDQ